MPPPTNTTPPATNEPLATLHALDWQLEHMPCGSHETMQIRDILRKLIGVMSPLAQRPSNWREQPARDANEGVLAPTAAGDSGPPVFDEQGGLVSGTYVSPNGRSTVVITSPPPARPPAPAPAPAPAAVPASTVIDFAQLVQAAGSGRPLSALASNAPAPADDAEQRFGLLELDNRKTAG